MITYAILFVVFIVGGTALLSWPLGRYMKWAMDPGCARTGAPAVDTRRSRLSAAASTRAVAGLEGATWSPCSSSTWSCSW